jgi:hypothetical protein
MAVWPFLLGASGITLGASLFSGHKWAARVMLAMTIALLAVRVKVAVFQDNQFLFVVDAAIWVIAAGAIPRQIAFNVTQTMLQLTVIRALFIASGLCSFWARIVDAPRVMWSAPYTTADLCLIVAMLIVWGSIGRDVLGRIRDMGRFVSGRSHVHLGSSHYKAHHKTSQKVRRLT